MSVIIAKCINIEKDKKFPWRHYLYFNKPVPDTDNIIWIRRTSSFSYATYKSGYNALVLNCGECNIEVNMFCIIYEVGYYFLIDAIMKEQLWHDLGSLENPSEDEIACYIELLNE